jgi:NAD(P)-dependent dehydrogenase (short-subunit alcohol dehydrogenase family)/acyl dehydratase
VTQHRSSTPADARQLRFEEDDIRLFSAASGDRNPLHLNPAFARRTPFGRCIVPGSLVSLALLGCLPREPRNDARSLRAWFAGPVLPGSTSTAFARAVAENGREEWEARLEGRGKLLARVAVSNEPDPTVVDVGSAVRAEPGPMRTAPAAVTLGDLRTGHVIAGSYRTGPELEQVARRWGVEELDAGLLEGLAWASYVVGMEVPGLHGLFAGVGLSSMPAQTTLEQERGWQWLSVRESDVRTGRLLVEGVLSATSGSRTAARIECFVREPIAPPDVAALAAPAEDDRSTGSVVVVGGSRGLGASLALALLMRGHTVHIAYSSSADAAAELSHLAGTHAERLFLHRTDARDSAQLEKLVEAVRHTATPLRGIVLSAAPPPLGMGVTGESGAEIAEYVAESVRLAATPLGTLLPLLDRDGGWVVFCSSSALSAPPRDWPHYVTAKAALEGLARWVAATHPNLRSVVFRPPKMRTDLTNSPSGRIAAASTEAVARWLVDRVSSGELPLGLTTLEPGLEEVSGNKK